MKNINVDIKFNNIHVTAGLNHNINILSGFSGTGKTLLMQSVALFCLNNNIKHMTCDSDMKDLDDKQIIEICKNAEVVLFDNADLYITDDILEYCIKNNKLIIMSIKNTSKINTENAAFYLVHYNNLQLTLEEHSCNSEIMPIE